MRETLPGLNSNLATRKQKHPPPGRKLTRRQRFKPSTETTGYALYWSGSRFDILPPQPFPRLNHLQFHVALWAAFAFFAFLVGVHRADIRLNRLLHRSATFGAFSTHFTRAFLMYRAAKNGRGSGFCQSHLAFRAVIALFACDFRVHRAAVSCVSLTRIFRRFAGRNKHKAAQQQ